MKTSINSLSCVMNSLGQSACALVRLSNAIAIVFLCWRAWKGNTRKIGFSRENFRSCLIFIRHAAGNTLNSFGFILLFLHAHAKIARRHENIYRAREHTRGESEKAQAASFSHKTLKLQCADILCGSLTQTLCCPPAPPTPSLHLSQLNTMGC